MFIPANQQHRLPNCAAQSSSRRKSSPFMRNTPWNVRSVQTTRCWQPLELIRLLSYGPLLICALCLRSRWLILFKCDWLFSSSDWFCPNSDLFYPNVADIQIVTDFIQLKYWLFLINSNSDWFYSNVTDFIQIVTGFVKIRLLFYVEQDEQLCVKWCSDRTGY